MSTMCRSAAEAGKIPVLTMSSGQSVRVARQPGDFSQGLPSAKEDLREFRSAYNRVAVRRSTLLRRIVASPRARPPPNRWKG